MTAQLKILVAVVAAAALLTPVASAGEAKHTVFKGEVVTVEPIFGPGNHEISVEILDASHWGRDTEGRMVAFFTDDETRIRVSDRDGDGEAGVPDLQPGIRVVVQGTGASFGGRYYATQVTHMHRSSPRD